MTRSLALALLVGTSLFLSAGSVHAQDEIRQVDPVTKKETTATGTIQEESPSQIIYKPGAGATTKKIGASDVVDVTYEVPVSVKPAYGRARADERNAANPALKDEDRRKALADAVNEYRDILPKLTGDRYKRAERHFQFKIARLLARQAEDEPDQADAAIEALTKFKKDYSDGWQIRACARLLAHLQLQKGDAAGAQKTYEELAASADLPKETKQEFELLAVEALVLGKKYGDAEARLQALLKSVPTDSEQAVRIRIYLAQCQGASGKLPEAVAQLEGIIAQTTDKSLKGLAYNALGDCYRVNGRGKDAIWPYLWVDVIYHQDKQEHIRALEQLAKLFDERGDKVRAKLYRDRLKKENR